MADAAVAAADAEAAVAIVRWFNPAMTILLQGAGASPQGDHPFLDRFNLTTLKAERIFQSAPDKYETVEAVLDDQGKSFITRRESATEPPNYILHNGSTEKALTAFTDPAPQHSPDHQATGDVQARRWRAAFDGAVSAARITSRARDCPP